MSLEIGNDPRQNMRPRGTIYEVARRYVACAYALADILGIDPYTMISKHREVVSNVFQQASREGIRIDSKVDIPRLFPIIVDSGTVRRAS